MSKLHKKGFCGIGIFNFKENFNFGSLERSAYCLSADFTFSVGRKYKGSAVDVVRAVNHVPYYNYLTVDDLLANRPSRARFVCIEITDNARELTHFVHPMQAVYLLGNEANGIPQKYLEKADHVVKLDSRVSLNVAVCGAIILAHRNFQMNRETLNNTETLKREYSESK